MGWCRDWYHYLPIEAEKLDKNNDQGEKGAEKYSEMGKGNQLC